MSLCSCPVKWAITVPNNKHVPLDPTSVDPKTKGALFLLEDKWAYSLKTLTERISKREQISHERAIEKIYTRYPAYLAHFTTCPLADDLRTRA